MHPAIPPRGVDVVLDFVGGPYWGKHMRCLAQDGRLVLLGLVSVHTGARCAGNVDVLVK